MNIKKTIFYCDSCGEEIKDNMFNVVFIDKGIGEPVQDVKFVHKGKCDTFRGMGWVEGKPLREDPISIIRFAILNHVIADGDAFADFFLRVSMDGYEKVRYKVHTDRAFAEKVEDIYGRLVELSQDTIKKLATSDISVPKVLYELKGETAGVKCNLGYLALDVSESWDSPQWSYNIAWSQFPNMREMIDWLHQLAGKAWARPEQLQRLYEVGKTYMFETGKVNLKDVVRVDKELLQLLQNPLSPSFRQGLINLCKKHDIKQPWV